MIDKLEKNYYFDLQKESQKDTKPTLMAPTRDRVIPFLKNLLTSSRLTRLVDLSPSDVNVITELATSITTSGKEANLWEILSRVNSTVKGRPNSKLAKLMARFYHNYIEDDLPGS